MRENKSPSYCLQTVVAMKKIVVLTGAGMSAESGLATFRGGGGLWDSYPVEQVATPEGYSANPALVLEFYNRRRVELLGVVPNKGHELLAAMEKDYDVTIVTQNVDDLHERAGSSKVIHLHGELMKGCSSRDPQNPEYVRCLSAENPFISIGDLADDGSQMRPFIVWFGEAVPMMDEAIQSLNGVDAFVIIGTSLNVYPAAGLLDYVPYGVPVYLIDPNEVRASRDVTVIRKGASEGVQCLLDKILSAE